MRVHSRPMALHGATLVCALFCAMWTISRSKEVARLLRTNKKPVRDLHRPRRTRTSTNSKALAPPSEPDGGTKTRNSSFCHHG